mgnify:CR=1 FL=1
MVYTKHYISPLGGILLSADEVGLTGLWFDGEKYYAENLPEEHIEADTPILSEAVRWLDIYFSGRDPGFTPPLHMIGTPFQISVWNLLRKIPYGTTTTYGAVASEIAAERGIARMSAQAVGGAGSHNAISIIIPCHRVVGAAGSLTAYAGGIEKKIWLLTHEGVDMKRFFVPKGKADI